MQDRRSELKRVQEAKAPEEYLRQTANTARTAHNLRKIVEFIRENPGCYQADIADMLSYSASGARKYLYRLEKSGVITVKPVFKGGMRYQIPTYTLINDTAKVEDFLSKTKTLEPEKKPAGANLPVKMKGTSLLPGTRIHSWHDDDELFSRKPAQNTFVKVERDALDRLLFGDGLAPSMLLEATA